MTPKELVQLQIGHQETTPIPYTLSYETPVADRLDAHYGSDHWRQRIVNHIVRVTTVDAEQRVVSEAHYQDMYGSVWRTDRRPTHLETPGLRSPSFDGYEFPMIERCLGAEQRTKAMDICRENADRFLAAGFGAGLFERTWFMCGFENALVYAAAEPDFYDELVERIFHLQLACVEESLKLPIDGIMFSDDWGDQRGVILGPERWRRFLKPRLAKLYERVHQAGKVTLSHCCGSVVDILPDMVEIGLDVLQSVQPEAAGMNPYELKKTFGDKIAFWGCLGSQSTIPFGTPDEIGREVGKLCSEMGRGGGYVLGPAKALQPETPTENAVAVVEAFTQQEAP